MTAYDSLSRRGRQIMDVLLGAEEATAEDVRRNLPDPPAVGAEAGNDGLFRSRIDVGVNRLPGAAGNDNPLIAAGAVEIANE